MGIFTDYGRYVKAREFKKFCNSGGGVWFAFGAGGHQWNTENIPKAPPCYSRQLSDLTRNLQMDVERRASSLYLLLGVPIRNTDHALVDVDA